MKYFIKKFDVDVCLHPKVKSFYEYGSVKSLPDSFPEHHLSIELKNGEKINFISEEKEGEFISCFEKADEFLKSI